MRRTMRPHRYDPKCPDCRPRLIDARTNQVVPEDDPIMKDFMAIWETSPIEQREALIDVALYGSRDAHDLAVITPLLERLKHAADGAFSG